MSAVAFDFSGAYTADGYSGVAWRAFAFEEVADEDTEWSGLTVKTGRILAHMVGDDRTFTFDPDELTPLDAEEYCSGCGQVGCGWGH